MSEKVKPERQTITKKRTSIKELLVFFVLAFALSWAFFIPAEYLLPDEYQTIFIILGAFGPLLSVLITTRVFSGKGAIKSWLKTTFNFKTSIWNYLLGAFLFPIGFGTMQYLIYRVLGGSSGFGEADPWYLYLFALIPTALLTGGNEEPGWRGFALPGLLEVSSPLAATLILGFMHSAWHIPLLGRYETNFIWYLFNLLPLTVFLNWFYLRSKGSIWPVMLLHASTNVIGNFIPTPDTVLGGWGDFMVMRGIVYWMIAIVILVATRGQLGWISPKKSNKINNYGVTG